MREETRSCPLACRGAKGQEARDPSWSPLQTGSQGAPGDTASLSARDQQGTSAHKSPDGHLPPSASRLCVPRLLCPWLFCGKAALILAKESKQQEIKHPSHPTLDGRASHRWTDCPLQSRTASRLPETSAGPWAGGNHSMVALPVTPRPPEPCPKAAGVTGDLLRPLGPGQPRVSVRVWSPRNAGAVEPRAAARTAFSPRAGCSQSTQLPFLRGQSPCATQCPEALRGSSG